MRSLKGSIVAALAAAVVLSSISFNAAEARSRHHRGNAAAVGAVVGLFGTIAALAAADSYRDRYYYGGGPYYGAYGPGYGYAPRYYYRHRHHHRHWR